MLRTVQLIVEQEKFSANPVKKNDDNRNCKPLNEM